MGPCLSKSANAPDSTTHPDTSSSKESENKESPHPTPDPHSKTATNSKIVVSELDETQRKDLPTNQSEHQSTNTLTVSPTTPMKDDRSNSSVWNMSNIDHEHEHKVQHSPINTRLDLDVRESRLMFQLKMQMEAAEEKFERERIEELRDEILDAQIKYQQEQHFSTLLQVFNKYVINPDRGMLDAEGLANALACLGMVIDFNKELQKMIFKRFDLDDQQEIDFMDFSAGLSQLITAPDEETLMLLFQIYDFDEDGFLDQQDVARILLTKNHFGEVQKIGQGTETQKAEPITYTRRQCLKQARKWMEPYTDIENGGKMSFEQFALMTKGRTERDMMIKFSPKPSNSRLIPQPAVSERCIPEDNTSSPSSDSPPT